MGLEEVQLCHVSGLIEQLFEIPEPPRAMVGGDPGGLLQRRRRVLLGHLQEPLHDAQALGAPRLMHCLGPAS